MGKQPKSGKVAPFEKPQTQQLNIDVSSLDNLTCSCGGMVFQNVIVLKKVSAIQSPNGQYGLVQVGVVQCLNCGITYNQDQLMSIAFPPQENQ